MTNLQIQREFDKIVKNKFNVYNSLFLNLPYPNVSHIGMLIPLLHHSCISGLEAGDHPVDILDAFFETHTNIKNETEKIDFMFRIVQYVERQVVLYDSVEDAAFPQLINLQNNLSIKDYINLSGDEKEGNTLLKKLSEFSTRIVFTAHPTQFYSQPVLDIIAKLRTLITENSINEIDIALQQLGLTSLINVKKPSPIDEARNVIYFLRTIYYNAAADLYNHIKKNVPGNDFDHPNIIQFGFWPGGDRDGNPFVTSETTKQVADELRMNLMKCYYADARELERKLTFRNVEQTIMKLRGQLYKAMFDSNFNISLEEISIPLNEIKHTLIEQYNSLYLDEVEKLIDKVKMFKLHFAALDIRQHHKVHKQTVEEILRNEKLIRENLDEIENKDLINILLNKKLIVKQDNFSDGIVKDTIETIAELKSIQSKNGEEGCNRYIISNSEDIYSVLFVFGLLRWCSWNDGELPFDIIPLFESIEAMKNSKSIMDELFNYPEYREHVRKRNNTQTIMLGFSDGTKDGGYLQANWSIFKTKEILTEVCDKHDVKAVFFDGRGGPPARGGGKTHRFYASQSDRIANNALQITIQGQTITSKYGTKEHFFHNSEQLLTAGLSHILSGSKNEISDKSRSLIEELALISHEKYNALKNHERFILYLEKKSTLKYYGKANIGSRPTKRGTSKKLELGDLRAIPFVGSWSQLKQNVPGYYGLGTALKRMIDDGKLKDLQDLFKEAPFFKALILNSMMSLSKCNFDLTKYITEDKEFKDFWELLYEEFLLSKELILKISGYSTLMEEEPLSRSSIDIREKIVLPLLVIQQAALQKIQDGTSENDKYEKIVKRSLYGNINASRNSA